MEFEKVDLYGIGTSLILFMAGIQLFGRTTLYFAILPIFIAYKILKHKSFYLTKEMYFLLSFCIFYIIFSIKNSIEVNRVMVDSIMFLIAYLSGKIAAKFTKNKDNSLKLYMYVISLGLLIHAYLNYLYTQSVGTYYDQILYDVWTTGVVPSTQVTSWFLPVIAIFFSIIMSTKGDVALWEKVYIFIGITITIVVNFNVAARTNILIIGLIIGMYICNKFIQLIRMRRFKYKSILATILFFIISLTIILVFNEKFIEVISLIKETPLIDRVNSLGENALINDPRVYRQLFFINNFTNSLWGGYYFRDNVGAMHNLWMDAYDSVGIIVFTFLVFYTISVIINLVKCYFSNDITSKSKLMLIGFYFTFMILFMTEPILESGPLMFTFFIFINGFTSNINATQQSNV